MGKNLTDKRLEACANLWRAGIKAETLYTEVMRTDKTFKYALENKIPLVLIIGEKEIQEGIYMIKVLAEEKQYSFPMDELI